LPLQWREWAIPLMRYGERFTELGHTGQSNATLLSDGDEDDHASEREPLASAPALSERSHRGLSRRLVTVCGSLDRGGQVSARPHPRTVLRCDWHFEDAADHDAVFEHVVVIIAIDRTSVKPMRA
jgi:hypothetical protein